jgi:hypothetical protein
MLIFDACATGQVAVLYLSALYLFFYWKATAVARVDGWFAVWT